VLKNDKNRAEYDSTYKPSENFKYNKAEDGKSFKFDYKNAKQKEEKHEYLKTMFSLAFILKCIYDIYVLIPSFTL